MRQWSSIDFNDGNEFTLPQSNLEDLLEEETTPSEVKLFSLLGKSINKRND